MKELILIAIGAALVNNVVIKPVPRHLCFSSVFPKRWIRRPAWAERLFLSSRFLHL